MAILQTELHRHLDVSARIETLLELAKERELEPESTTLSDFRRKIVLTSPLADLGTVLATFTFFQNVLDRYDVLERIAFEAVEDCYQEGTRKIEFRFSPAFLCERSKLPWQEALDGITAGVARAKIKYPEMQVGLLCIISREYGIEGGHQTLEFYLKNQGSFVGMDLAGDENQYSNRPYIPIFKKVKESGGRITIHAGEGSHPDHVWEAIEDLGAERIGHGVSSIKDPKLMDFLREKQICLEVCPTSNYLTQAVASIKEHPLPKLVRAGVPVSINTDDPGVFGMTLPDEIRICREIMGMTAQEIEICFRSAEKSSFV